MLTIAEAKKRLAVEDCSLHPAQTHSDPGCTWLREIFQHTARALYRCSLQARKIAAPSGAKGIGKISAQGRARLGLHQ